MYESKQGIKSKMLPHAILLHLWQLETAMSAETLEGEMLGKSWSWKYRSCANICGLKLCNTIMGYFRLVPGSHCLGTGCDELKSLASESVHILPWSSNCPFFFCVSWVFINILNFISSASGFLVHKPPGFSNEMIKTAFLYSFSVSSYIMSCPVSRLPSFAQPSSHTFAVVSSSLPIGLLQVQQSQEKIARLEQEKEHWLLEAQLGKVRLEKENQRIADLEAQLEAALGGSLSSQAATANIPAQSYEEAETEQKAAGKETTLCTSLVEMLPVCFSLTNDILCLWHWCLICLNKGSIIILFL